MSFTGTVIILFTFAFIFFIVFKVVLPPLNYPRNIPTIPFYVIFLPSIYLIDQTKLYDLYIRESMEKYGAVKIFFGSRWNILVSKPDYLKQIFKDEETFAKSGNQKKIPYSLIAAYTGDNIISAHGEVWKKYRSVVTSGLQHFDNAPFYDNVRLFCKLIKESTSKTHTAVLMGPLIQRLALANISKVALGFDIGTLTQKHCPLQEHLIRIKKQIFHPFFLTFPFFDILPLPQRRRGFKDVQSFRDELVSEVQSKLVKNYKFEQTTYASSDLIRAYNNQIIDYKQLTDNIIILLIAGHENPQLAITSLLYLLAKNHSNWQAIIRQEVKNTSKHEDLISLPLLNSFIYETLRFFPPLSIIINRCTSRNCRLGLDIVIPKNTYVGYHNFGTTHDQKTWGDDANEFNPSRWGKDIDTITNVWKHAKMDCRIPTFHGGKRACLGEKLALTELRITVAEVLKKFELKLPPNFSGMMTPAGPLCPHNLMLQFKEINSD